jgi:hypothetical protein
MRKSSAQSVDVTIDELGKRLEAYVEAQAATKKDGSIRELIAKLRPRLMSARNRGLTYAELTAWLNQQGIACGESTVRTYISAPKRAAKLAPRIARQATPVKKRSPLLYLPGGFRRDSK